MICKHATKLLYDLYTLNFHADDKEVVKKITRKHMEITGHFAGCTTCMKYEKYIKEMKQ